MCLIIYILKRTVNIRPIQLHCDVLCAAVFQFHIISHTQVKKQGRWYNKMCWTSKQIDSAAHQ